VHVDDVGAIVPGLRNDATRRGHVPGGENESPGGGNGARRVVDDMLRDLMAPSQQQHALALHHLILAPGDAMPVVHLQNAHLPAATHRTVRAPRPGGGHPEQPGLLCCRLWAQLGHN
jgi:hypothetical protein